MRAIDADKLKELLLKERDAIPKTVTERYGFGVPKQNHSGDQVRGGIRKALRCMEQTPTITYADLVPHGRWESCEEDGVVVCSVCGNVETQTSYFCRCCGTKMDGGKDNERT